MKAKELVHASKLTKNLKIIWRYYRELIKNKFVKKWNKCNNEFQLFISIEPYYAIRFMHRIRKVLFKIVAGNGTVNIQAYIRSEEENKLGIMIRYEH